MCALDEPDWPASLRICKEYVTPHSACSPLCHISSLIWVSSWTDDFITEWGLVWQWELSAWQGHAAFASGVLFCRWHCWCPWQSRVLHCKGLRLDCPSSTSKPSWSIAYWWLCPLPLEREQNTIAAGQMYAWHLRYFGVQSFVLSVSSCPSSSHPSWTVRKKKKGEKNSVMFFTIDLKGSVTCHIQFISVRILSWLLIS